MATAKRGRARREKAAHSQSEPWVLMWRTASGGLELSASFPLAISCSLEERGCTRRSIRCVWVGRYKNQELDGDSEHRVGPPLYRSASGRADQVGRYGCSRKDDEVSVCQQGPSLPPNGQPGRGRSIRARGPSSPATRTARVRRFSSRSRGDFPRTSWNLCNAPAAVDVSDA